MQGTTVARLNVTTASVAVLRTPLLAGYTPKFRLVRNGASVIMINSRFSAVRTKVTYQDFLYRSGNSLRAAYSAVNGTCASFCEAGNAARCLNCPGDSMWLLSPRV